MRAQKQADEDAKLTFKPSISSPKGDAIMNSRLRHWVGKDRLHDQVVEECSELEAGSSRITGK